MVFGDIDMEGEDDPPKKADSISAALLPCPFCGGEAQRFRSGRNVWVGCASLEADCLARMMATDGEMESAESKWNRRVSAYGTAGEHHCSWRESLGRTIRDCYEVLGVANHPEIYGGKSIAELIAARLRRAPANAAGTPPA